MDNAISALKIAAAMLFAILILSCLMYVRKSLKKIPEIEQERRRKAEIQEFNNMFFSYDKGQMYGTDVISCMNLV